MTDIKGGEKRVVEKGEKGEGTEAGKGEGSVLRQGEPVWVYPPRQTSLRSAWLA